MNAMKNVLLFGYGKMGSSIARGWILKELNFNFFIIEKEASLNSLKVFIILPPLLNPLAT